MSSDTKSPQKPEEIPQNTQFHKHEEWRKSD